MRNWFTIPKNMKDLAKSNGNNAVFGCVLDTTRHRIASIGPGPAEPLAEQLMTFCIHVLNNKKTPEEAFKLAFGNAKPKKSTKRAKPRKKVAGGSTSKEGT